MRKAQNHRKRHLPPGPCGIWFQAQQQHLNNGVNTSGDPNAPNSRRRRSSGGVSSPPSSQAEEDRASAPNDALEDVSLCPAWALMQQELGLVTPYLPPTVRTPSERHRLLRAHMPPEHPLLWEIIRGDLDATFLRTWSERGVPATERRLLVMVSSVESHINHNTWTVELLDETWARVRAWIEPTLVQEQLQQPHEDSIIRPGVVWQLDCGGGGLVVVPPPPDQDEEALERMLLVKGSAIRKHWTPEQTKRVFRENHDDPHQQRRFLEWMEKRKAIPLLPSPSLMGRNEEGTSSVVLDGGEEEDDDEGPDDMWRGSLHEHHHRHQGHSARSTVLQDTEKSRVEPDGRGRHTIPDEDEALLEARTLGLLRDDSHGTRNVDNGGTRGRDGSSYPITQEQNRSGTTTLMPTMTTPSTAAEGEEPHHPWARIRLGDVPASPQRAQQPDPESPPIGRDARTVASSSSSQVGSPSVGRHESGDRDGQKADAAGGTLSRSRTLQSDSFLSQPLASSSMWNVSMGADQCTNATKGGKGGLPSWKELLMEDEEDLEENNYYANGDPSVLYRNEKIPTEQTSQNEPAAVASVATEEAALRRGDTEPTKGWDGGGRKRDDSITADDEESLNNSQEHSGPMMGFPSLFAASNLGSNSMALFEENDEEESDDGT